MSVTAAITARARVRCYFSFVKLPYFGSITSHTPKKKIYILCVSVWLFFRSRENKTIKIFMIFYQELEGWPNLLQSFCCLDANNMNGFRLFVAINSLNQMARLKNEPNSIKRTYAWFPLEWSSIISCRCCSFCASKKIITALFTLFFLFIQLLRQNFLSKRNTLKFLVGWKQCDIFFKEK